LKPYNALFSILLWFSLKEVKAYKGTSPGTVRWTCHTLSTNKCLIKGRVHCFSMQVVMKKCFLLNPGKKLAQILLVIFEKNAKNAHFNSEK